MTSRDAIVLVAIACLAAAIADDLARAQSAPQKLLVGDTQVEIVVSYKGAELLPKPDKTLIYNFTVPTDVVTMDQSAAARLQRGRLQRREPDADSSTEALAKQVQAAFAKTLVSELQSIAIPAEMAPATDEAIPPHTLILHGEFTTINQGKQDESNNGRFWARRQRRPGTRAYLTDHRCPARRDVRVQRNRRAAGSPERLPPWEWDQSRSAWLARSARPPAVWATGRLASRQTLPAWEKRWRSKSG